MAMLRWPGLLAPPLLQTSPSSGRGALEAYLAASRPEQATTGIVAAGSGMQAVGVASRLSVLLNGRGLRVPIVWLGPATSSAHAQLEAAGVRVCDLAAHAARAALLAGASAFVYFCSMNRPSIAVLQAMAAGVPCLVPNAPAHRALVRHGETGILCRRERDYLDALVVLLRDPAIGQRLGAAARAHANHLSTPRSPKPVEAHVP